MNIVDKIKAAFTGGVTEEQHSVREVISLNDPKLVEYLVGEKEITEAVFSVISRVSNTFASLPLKMIDISYKQPKDCKAYNLLVDGPRYFTKFDFFRDIEVLRNYQGNAYVQLFRNINGEIVDMALIKPGACSPVIDMDSGELYYHVTANDKKNYRKGMYVHYMEMLHFKQIRIGGILGKNPLSILNNTLNFDNEVRKISLNQLMGGNEGLKVKFSGNLNEEDQKATIKNIADFYKNNGGLLVQDNGTEIERIQRELVDSKLLDTDKISKSKIAMVFNVPEHFVGSSNGSYATLEQLNMEFLTYSLIPIVTQYEEELNKKTLTPANKKKGYRYKFNVAGLLRADTQTRGNFYQIMRRNSSYSGNDIRRYEDLPPSELPEMEEYYISGDLYPITMPPELRKTTKNDKE